MDENNILGVVLAGGKSKRFGNDKTNIKLGDKTLLKHTLDKIKSKLDKIIVITNREIENDFITIKDCIDGQLGPLVGVLSAMKWVANNNGPYKWVMTFPCDTPFFYTSVIDKFIIASKNDDSLLYFANNSTHNIIASGGVSNINDITSIAKLETNQVIGVIVGKAILSGKIKLNTIPWTTTV